MRTAFKMLVPAAALAFATSAAAQGEWRCDCTQIVASCEAGVSIQGNWVEVTANDAQCARVDYFIDGLPFVALVVDGVERQNWIARTEEARVLVQSCQVCRDNAANAPAPAAASAAPAQSDAELTPIIEVSPRYPEAAQAQGLEGFVEVSFTVTPQGTVQDASVVASEPGTVFDAAALAAVRQWRYLADESRAPQTLEQRLPFTLSDYILGLPARPARAAGNAVTSPRSGNQCVREQYAYNYGDMVEIGLMNACSEPLLVFSCAQGTGQYLGRWDCVDSESRQNLLVPPGDARIGSTASVEVPAGSRSFRYAEDLLVRRAPNSEYWWLACTRDDRACRENARLWLRSIDGQVATIDPQSRTTRTLARSY
jgi:TonB family protein